MARFFRTQRSGGQRECGESCITAAAGLILMGVLSAFRMTPGGAQGYLKVTPDLCILGKAVGGGFPLSVFGGRRDIMGFVQPRLSPTSTKR